MFRGTRRVQRRKKKIEGTDQAIGWPELIRMGMGVLCLSPSAFWSMTFGEISLAVDGHREAEEYRERYAWERARWLGAMTFQPHLKKGRKLAPTDLMQFPWEKPEQNAKKLTKEELKQRILERDEWQS